jgi:hypothetical protein
MFSFTQTISHKGLKYLLVVLAQAYFLLSRRDGLAKKSRRRSTPSAFRIPPRYLLDRGPLLGIHYIATWPV